MDMSAAALPPRNGPVFPSDTQHPRYGEYRTYRSSMTRLMVDASGFRDWLAGVEYHERLDKIAEHPRMAEFRAWMRETKAGGRKCLPSKNMPHGLAFPDNFRHWLEGGRW